MVMEVDSGASETVVNEEMLPGVETKEGLAYQQDDPDGLQRQAPKGDDIASNAADHPRRPNIRIGREVRGHHAFGER